jgi:hypothetical protein
MYYVLWIMYYVKLKLYFLKKIKRRLATGYGLLVKIVVNTVSTVVKGKVST